MRAVVRLILVAVLALVSACTWLWQESGYQQREGVSSSLVDYLYPKGEVPPEREATIPRLELPLRVGIAFVPADGFYAGTLSEATKNDLLNQVKARFVDRKYVEHIEVIPETYLRSSKGFEGLQQVARLYGVDVMALVSYDQVAATADTKASILYWTIVGAYVIEATANEVQTFVDTAVFDVATQKLLFRAPGINRREFRSTAVENPEKLREERTAGFTAAMGDMTDNLVQELDRFEDRLEQEPTLAQVEWSEKSEGGGAAADWLVLLVMLLPGGRRLARRRAPLSRIPTRG